MAKTINELYKQYQSGQGAGAKTPASSTTNKKETSEIDRLYDRWRKQDYEKNREQWETSVNEKLTSLTSRQSSFGDAYSSRYQNRKDDTYVSDYDSWLEKVTQEKERYDADVRSFWEEFARYQDFYDAETVSSINTMLSTGQTGFRQALIGAQADRDYFSQWETEEDFRSYLTEKQDYEAKKNLNIDAAQKEIWQLEELYKEYTTLSRLNLDEKGEARVQELYDQYGYTYDLKNLISEKKAYLNQAKHIQEGYALSAVADPESGSYDEKFRPLSRYNTTINKDASWWENGVGDTQYEWINNRDGFREEYERSMADLNAKNGASSQSGFYVGPTESVYTKKGYDKMNDDEVAIYNYYYAKEGKEKAQEYLDSIQETLNQRKAHEIYEPMEDQTILELAFGVAAGLDQFSSGIQNLFNTEDDYIPATATQMASGMVREDLGDVGPNLPKWLGGGSLGQMGYDTITTTANMAPSILTSVAVSMLNPIAGQVTGSVLMGASAAGNAYQEALNQGYDKDQARGYGLLVGASEIVMEKVLGGISAVGGNALGKFFTKNVANADTALKMIAKRIGGSMLSEFGEEYLQEVLTPVFQNMMLGTDNDVKLFSAEALYSGILGALTASVMEGPTAIVGEVKTANTGKKLQAAGVTAQQLAEVGNKFSADTVAYQLAGKVDENTGAYTMGRLFNEIGANLTEQNKSEITEALIQEGMSESIAKKNAEVLAYIVDGGEVSDIQMKMIEKNNILSKVMKEVIIDSNSTVYQRTMGYNEALMALAQEKTLPNASRTNPAQQGEANVSSEGTLSSSTKVLAQSNYEASEDGKTILDGKEVTLDGIRKMADGSTMVATADNLTADPSEVTYPSKDHALVYESYVNLESTTSNPVIASMPMEDRSALAKSYDPAAGVPANVFVQGSNQAFYYGFEGISMDEKTVPKNSLVMSISKEQRAFAYDLGRKAGEKAAKTQQAGIEAAQKAAVEQMGGEIAAKAIAKKNKGTVILDDGIQKSKLKPKQKASYNLAVRVAEKTGVNIRFYSGMKEYGKYDRETGEIWLNINAYSKGHSMMVFTLAHELVHMAKQWSPAEFKAFADYLLEQYGKKGVSVEYLIKEQMNRAVENGYTIDEHVAYEEVIADACERMLLDSDALAKMYGYKLKNPDRWQQIVDAITKFIDNIRTLFDGAEADSEEAELYKMLDEESKKFLENQFVKMVMDAGAHQATIQNAFGKDKKLSAEDKKKLANLRKGTRFKMPKSNNPYSYEALVSKPDMMVTTVGENVPENRADLVRMAKQNATMVGKMNPKSGSVSVYVKDIGRDVGIGRDGLKHSLDGGRISVNAPVLVKVGEIISNSIRINELIPREDRIDESYVLIGAARNADNDLYIVRSVVNRFSHNLVSLDVLYAINAKKEPAALLPLSAGNPALGTDSTISIAKLLDYVNQYFPDILPEEVLKHYGHDSRPAGKLGEDALYKTSNSRSVSSRELLADAFDELVQSPDERELMDQYRANITKVEEVQERLRKLRGEISKLTKAKGDKAKINKLNETAADLVDLIDMYDRKLLELEASKPLRDVLARARTDAQKEAKQRTEEVMKEYRQQVSERFDRGVDSRRKTEMRKKIRKVIRDLSKILNHGDKKRNVKEDMKDFVAEALSTAEFLFTETITDEDIIRNGFQFEILNPEQEQAYREAYEILKKLDDARPNSMDEVQLKGWLSYRKSKLKDAFFKERLRLNETEVAEVLGKLADAYAKLEDSEYAYVNGAFHEEVYQHLKNLQDDVGGAKIKDMTLGQLEELYKAYTMVLTTVRNANKMFAEDLKQSKEELANRVMMEVYQAGGEHGLWSKGELARNQASWNNTKPIYAAERIGSPTFVKLVNGLFKGQYAWAVDMAEAKAYRQKVADKYGFKKWDMEKLYKFTSSSGIEFELNLDQIMSLYAYAKREQAHDHLLKGGFVFGKNTEVVVTKNGIKRTYLNKSAKAHNISDEIMGEIISKLSKEQKGFVDEMQDYLSTTMGAKGNEVSMRIYGVKLFLEKFYFPLRSAGQFKEKAKEAELKQQQGQISIVNAGFTKAVTPKASNPVVLDGFMDVWAGHVNEMSLYHSMVLPMEDFRRVYNYASPHMEGQESASVNSFIENAHGDAATGYFDQLYKELNGGAIVDPRENLSKQMIGKFKKSAVMLSNSVWVQQFSSIGRAYALIDPKYFIGAKVDKQRHAMLWEEMKRYAPITIIKEMGGFDTHTGRSANDFLLAEEYGNGERIKGFAKDEKYRSEVMGLLPAKADEMTWAAIWEAVKRETQAKNPKMDVKSEAFLTKAGERFSEVIEKTQVYDSVLARSANMRSKQGLMQMVTAFMAEPTTTVNMIEDALRKGNKTVIARTFGAVAVSIILNNALASIVYAMRDDDEDETFLEKYAQAVTSGMLDDLNPLTYYPILKDIWSLFQGYDIERSDMAIYSDIADAVKKTVSIVAKYDSDMDEEESAEYYKKVGDALMSLLDAGASAFGVPLKNVRRDLMSYFNTIKTFTSGNSTTWNSFKDAIGGAALDNIPLVGLFTGKSKQDKLYDAIVSGDTAYLNRLKDSYSSETSYNTAVRKALRENDPRIYEAAVARFSGNLDEYMRIAKEIIAEGHFSQDNVVAAINAEINALDKGETTTSAQKASGLFKAEDFAVAISQDDSAMANAIKVDIIQTAQRNGKTEEEAEKSFVSSAKSNLKEMFLAGEITEDQAIGALTAYCGVEQEDAEDDVGEWVFKAEFPDQDITYTQYKRWQVDGQPNGVSLELFTEVADFRDDETSGSTRSQEEVADYIDSLPVSTAQKDALWCCFWKESTLKNAPWH